MTVAMARSNLALLSWLVVVGSLSSRWVHAAPSPARPGGLRATVARATQAAPPPTTTPTVPVCAAVASSGVVGRNTFQTVWVPTRDVWRYLIFGRAAVGTCLGVCASTMCREYPSFNVSGNRQNSACQCLGTRIVCGRHGRVNGSTKKCDCFSGYRQAVNNGICVDVNECAESSSSCPSNQECVNTRGSFSCTPIACATPFGNPCGPGRACVDAPSGFTCQDIPGGVQCPAGCDPNSTCINNECICNAGFARPQPFLPCVEQGKGNNTTLVPSPQNATTVPPKQTPTTTCGINAAVSHDNATKCECLSGYQGDDPSGAGCTDVDECALVTRCAPNQECVNTAGSFSCTPRTCATPFGNPCGPGRPCIDTPTGFTCQDIPGGVQCPAGCEPNSTCINNECICNAGFARPQPFLPCVEQGGNNSTAPPLPKQTPTTTCGINAAVSHDNATKCECLSGYQGDDPSGAGCTDIDECALVTRCAPNQECVNTVGSFSCTPRTCATPFGNPCGPGRPCTDTPTGFTCQDIPGGVQCPAGCEPNSTCINNECICNDGFLRPQPFLPCVAQTGNNNTGTTLPPPTCGANAVVSLDDGTKCVCLPGYQGDDPSSAGCADIDECLQLSNPSRCASNQKCSNTDGSFTCAPIPCANMFGNPCGPDKACTDTPTGYTCSDLVGPAICPAGCGPNSTCGFASPTATRATCQCNAGFVRPNPALGCVPLA
jgi:Calcium-binding EGF domain